VLKNTSAAAVVPKHKRCSGSSKTQALQRYSSVLKNSVEKAEDLYFFVQFRQENGLLLSLPCSAALAIQAPRCSGGSKNNCASAQRRI
jgi:hypothetical protein